jgi:hypothetical protein
MSVGCNLEVLVPPKKIIDVITILLFAARVGADPCRMYQRI